MNFHGVPYWDQYFGLWLMEESQFWQQFGLLRGLDLHLHMQSGAPQTAASRSDAGLHMQGDIAVVQLNGKLMKQASSMGGGTSTVAVRRQIRAAMNDTNVRAVSLLIDSPGGTAAGTQELADDVAALADRKPVHAFIEDLGASAAYWVACQATRVVTNPTGMVGSIGTYGVVYDMSQAAAMEGVKAHVIRAGKYKGMGTPGTEISPEQLAEWQRGVDAINQHFLAGVSRGRNMTAEKVAELADGRAHIGQEALRLGLVDAVESYDQAFETLTKTTSTKRRKMNADHILPDTQQIINHTESTTMADTQKPSAATPKEIRAACVGCDADFVLAQVEAGATLAEVKDAWMTKQQEALRASQEEAAKLKAENAKLQTAKTTGATKAPGVKPVQAGSTDDSGDGSEDPKEEFDALVAANIKAGMSKQRAVCAASAANPELHQRMLRAHNDKHGRPLARVG